MAWLAASLLVMTHGEARAWFPERTTGTPMPAGITESWLRHVDVAPGRMACGLARLIEPHLDALPVRTRDHHLQRWSSHRDSPELATFGRWLRRADVFATAHAAHVGQWLVCSTPAGEEPRGPVREGSPCFSGGHERVWTRIASDLDSGLLWLDDFVVSAAAERQERLHLIALAPVPTAARTLRGGASAAAVEIMLVADPAATGPDATSDRAAGTAGWRATDLEHATFDQWILPLAPVQAQSRGRRWVYMQVRPSSTQTTRVRLRFDTDAEPIPDATAMPPDNLLTGVRDAIGTLRDMPQHPCRPDQEPWMGPVFGRLLGHPDAGARPEDLLLELPGTARGLEVTLLALPALRRDGARQAVLGHFEGVATADRLAMILLASAQVSLERAEPERARILLDRATAETGQGARASTDQEAFGRFVGARLALAEGMPEKARLLLEEGLRNDGDAPAMRLLLGRALLAEGRDRDARAVVDRVASAAAFPEHPGVTALRMSMPSFDGFAESDARRALDRAARSPSRTRLALDAARWVARHAGRSAALEVLEPWLQRPPRPLLSVAVRNEMAELLESLGDQESAVRVATETLRLDPTDAGTRRLSERLRVDVAHTREGLIDTLSKNAPEGLFARIEEPETLTRLRALPRQTLAGGWEILDEQVWVQVAPDGSSTRVARRVLRADATPGAALQRTPWRWTFDPSRVNVRMLHARIHRLDATRTGGAATAVNLPLRGIRTEERPPDTALVYYDEHALIIPVDAVEPGDLVELLWIVEPTGHFFPGHFELLEPLQLHMFRHRYALTLDAPPNLDLHQRLLPTARPGPAAPHPTRAPATPLPDGRLRHALVVGPTPGIPSESFAPPTSETAAVWQVTTLADDAALGRFWADLVQPQAVVTTPMREAVARIVDTARTKGGGVDTARAARALARLVSEHIRYVGLEFGIHGYKPYRTDDVWARRFGDCKDQALVLVSLMREAGIAADPVLVRTRRLGRLGREGVEALPMLAAFDHAIVYIRDRHHFVDPTALHHGYDTLHPDNQGADALIVPLDGKDAERVTLPRDPPSRNGVRGDFAVLLNADGSAHVTGRMRYVGIQAGGWRARLADESRRSQSVQMMVGARFPGFELQRFEVEGLDADASHLKLSFEGRVGRLAQVEGGRLEVRDPLPLGGQRSRLGEAERRMLPLTLGTPSSGQFEVQWTLPRGWETVTLPEAHADDLTSMRTRVEWERADLDDANTNETVTGRVELTFLTERVAPEALPALAAALGRFDGAVARPLVARLRTRTTGGSNP